MKNKVKKKKVTNRWKVEQDEHEMSLDGVCILFAVMVGGWFKLKQDIDWLNTTVYSAVFFRAVVRYQNAGTCLNRYKFFKKIITVELFLSIKTYKWVTHN